MVALDSVEALPGLGLEGDRYAAGTGTFSPHPRKADFEVTLIEQERIEEYAATAVHPFTAESARRNLVTAGVDLNALVGREFRIGGVVLRGIRLCEPCNYLAKITHPDVLRGLVHRGGLRAQIVSGGRMRRGDPLEVLHPPASPPSGP